MNDRRASFCHPEVEGTMGQYSNPEGGMYLVESPEDVLTLNVKNEARLSFMTQTTLSVDDTSDVIDALRQRFPKIVGPRLYAARRFSGNAGAMRQSHPTYHQLKAWSAS